MLVNTRYLSYFTNLSLDLPPPVQRTTHSQSATRRTRNLELYESCMPIHGHATKTRQIFHLLTQNMIAAFKFCARAIFSLLEKTPPLVHKI